ncbi:MAG TPA: LuxR family transcriptional regulator, partial [Gammaproteobacteria bacterium]|nr:LuxR family transcriptional regulator [Gammaproteobacteria bacterium]
FFNLLVRKLPRGQVSADHLLIPDRQALREQCVEFYDDFMIPNDIYHIGGAGLLVDGDQMGAIAIQRRRELGPWSDDELVKLGMLSEHFQRAFRIHREFTRLRTHEYAAYAMFDQLIIGLVLINASHQVTYSNPTAQSILGTHPALKIHNQRIFATKLEDRKRVNALIQDTIIGKNNDEESMLGGVLGLRHPDCSFPLLLLSMPVTELRNALRSTIDSASIALFISDPERTQPISPDALMETFDLTHAEAAVTIALANGLNPKEIAQSKNVSTDTVRSQLKSIFRKTGTGSQVELVRLLLTGPFGTFCIQVF